MIASYTKFKDIDSFKIWVNHLPRKFSMDYRKNLFGIMNKGDHVLWTENDGIKII